VTNAAVDAESSVKVYCRALGLSRQSRQETLSACSRNFVGGDDHVGYKTMRAPGPTTLVVRPIRAS
jgi:hypothetical protein